MNSSLFGNPHSLSPSSQLSTTRVENTRKEILKFFKADPEHFDLVFVANATAAIKLVADCTTAYSRLGGHDSFRYVYHEDSHTSLVGLREVAVASTCLGTGDVEEWLSRGFVLNDDMHKEPPCILAYPAQSNMTGRRLPLEWVARLRNQNRSASEFFSLLDAAAYVTTAQLDLSNHAQAPDFTVLSFYKIFGFPDLGALIVRKEAGHVLSHRKYFGGGTVEMVVNGSGTSSPWHASKQASLHDRLEDGTPPFHSIVALETALKVHRKLYGSQQNVSQYTCSLVRLLYNEMIKIKYDNGRAVCKIYKNEDATYGNSKTQGPTIAFNICRSDGTWIGKSDFEGAAIKKNIQLRTGGVCNPGGIARALDLSSEEMKESFAEGVRCGNDIDEMHGKPTGIVRVSLGAMSSRADIHRFLHVLQRFAVEEGEGAVRASSLKAGMDEVPLVASTILPSRTKPSEGVVVQTSAIHVVDADLQKSLSSIVVEERPVFSAILGSEQTLVHGLTA